MKIKFLLFIFLINSAGNAAKQKNPSIQEEVSLIEIPAAPTPASILEGMFDAIKLYESGLSACLGCGCCQWLKQYSDAGKYNHVEKRKGELKQMKDILNDETTSFSEKIAKIGDMLQKMGSSDKVFGKNFRIDMNKLIKQVTTISRL